jgi:hypothetical protein
VRASFDPFACGSIGAGRSESEEVAETRLVFRRGRRGLARNLDERSLAEIMRA